MRRLRLCPQLFFLGTMQREDVCATMTTEVDSRLTISFFDGT